MPKGNCLKQIAHYKKSLLINSMLKMIAEKLIDFTIVVIPLLFSLTRLLALFSAFVYFLNKL